MKFKSYIQNTPIIVKGRQKIMNLFKYKVFKLKVKILMPIQLI